MSEQVEQRPGHWTVADIGGTHARLARWTAAAGLDAHLRVRNDEFRGPVELLEAWLSRQPESPRRVVLALAMPVDGDTRQLTNRAWRFEPGALMGALHLESLVIVNDFAAAAAGIDALSRDDLRLLNADGMAPVRGVRLVVGPGTGLGVAAVAGDDPPRIIASEAGHMTFGSAAPIAAQLNAEGRSRWGRVSWERLLCGDGLAWLHAVTSGRGELEGAANVARAAAAGDPSAVSTVRLFSGLLGEFAGDVCLAFQALEGVYLSGGVLGGLLDTFDAPAFMAAFAAKGRFSNSLRRVPVYFAAGHELGMQGAARFLAGQCRMPSTEWHA
ncbi:MAG: glucokinase [Burkholderiaceae bacterium]